MWGMCRSCRYHHKTFAFFSLLLLGSVFDGIQRPWLHMHGHIEDLAILSCAGPLASSSRGVGVSFTVLPAQIHRHTLPRSVGRSVILLVGLSTVASSLVKTTRRRVGLLLKCRKCRPQLLKRCHFHDKLKWEAGAFLTARWGNGRLLFREFSEVSFLLYLNIFLAF